MKKITLLFVLLAVSFGYSQELVTNGDFQTGVGTPWYNGGVNVQDLGGGTWVNQVEVTTAGNPWDVNISQDIVLENGKTYELTYDAWTDATTGTRSMVAGLGQNGPGWASLTENPALTATSQPFSHQFTINYGDGVPDRVLFDMGAETGFVFIDNVSVQEIIDLCSDGVLNNGETEIDCGGPNCDACPEPPTTSAPTPPARVAGDVVSIFTNGEYADVTASGVNVFAGASYDNFTIDTADDTRRLTAPNPGGGAQYEFFNASPALDLSGFTHAHVDFFVEGPVAPGQLFQIFLLNFPNYPDGAGATNLNTSFDVNTLGSGTWISGDVELASFGGDLTRDKVALVQVVAAGAPAFGPIYIDNIYFHKNTTLGTDDFEISGLKIYPNPSNNVWNVKTNDQIIKTVQVFDVLGKEVMTMKPNKSDVEIEASTLPKGLYFAKLTTDLGSNSVKLIKN